MNDPVDPPSIERIRELQKAAQHAVDSTVGVEIRRQQAEEQERKAREEAARLAALTHTGFTIKCGKCSQLSELLMDAAIFPACCGDCSPDSDMNVELICSLCGQTVLDWWSE